MPTRRELANALRFLAIDAVQEANSGHPGMPMGMADIAEVLWRDFIRVSPANPDWFNRDRFVLSNGHGAMLLYGLLHLTGFDLPIDELKQFRQLHSKTPGHPEYLDTPGVETTTGPLGQGLANAVGMAIAEKHLAAQFNTDEFPIVDHHTYVFIGDGCLMEGISHEVCSLAGHFKLGKLVVFWDDNGISIDGKTSGWFTTDTPARFKAYNWHVIEAVDGHDSDAVKKAIEEAKAQTDQPTLICCKTHIGFGAPNLVDSEKSHGSPLGVEEIAATRQALNWPHAPFEVPDDIREAWSLSAKGQDEELLWNHLFAKYEGVYPEKAKEFLRIMQHWLPDDWSTSSQEILREMLIFDQPEATRKSSLQAITAFAPALPELMGGSADLSGSNCTKWAAAVTFTPDHSDGNYIHYGVREFGMAAMMNGMALHGGLLPFGGTFLVFSDYARNAIRMSALMQQCLIYVFSHDSIGLGEDGPTHQPIEQTASLRLVPNLDVWRPADRIETMVAWQHAIERRAGPSALLLSRQNLPQQAHVEAQLEHIAKGGYVLHDCDQPEAVIMATGSEVMLAIEAANLASKQGQRVRVVSMPCVELFMEQSYEYRQSVLPDDIQIRVAVEAGATTGWHRFVGRMGAVVGWDQFGFSAPASDVYTACEITVEHVMEALNDLFQRRTMQMMM